MVTHSYYGFHCVPDWQWSVQANGHPDYTLWSVWGGKGILRVGEKSYSLKKGDVFLLDYSRPVFGTEDRADNLEVRFLDFGTSSPLALQGIPCYRHFESTSFLLELFRRVASAQSSKDQDGQLIWSNALVREFFQQIKSPSISPYTEQIERVCAQFEEHPERHYEIRQLARSIGLTPDCFIRVFAKEKEATPYAYLSHVRVDSAKALLLNSSLSVSQIAVSLGFSGLYNFSRFFKQATGKSPSEYRKQLKHKTDF